MFLVSYCSCPCPNHWSHVLSRECRCRWNSADRRCSNYIWVINNGIVCWLILGVWWLSLIRSPILVYVSVSQRDPWWLWKKHIRQQARLNTFRNGSPYINKNQQSCILGFVYTLYVVILLFSLCRRWDKDWEQSLLASTNLVKQFLSPWQFLWWICIWYTVISHELMIPPNLFYFVGLPNEYKTSRLTGNVVFNTLITWKQYDIDVIWRNKSG